MHGVSCPPPPQYETGGGWVIQVAHCPLSKGRDQKARKVCSDERLIQMEGFFPSISPLFALYFLRHGDQQWKLHALSPWLQCPPLFVAQCTFVWSSTIAPFSTAQKVQNNYNTLNNERVQQPQSCGSRSGWVDSDWHQNLWLKAWELMPMKMCKFHITHSRKVLAHSAFPTNSTEIQDLNKGCS